MNEHIVLLKTLADPTRLKLLKLVLKEELCVCELQELLQISQPAVSQHVAKLKTAGVVVERRAGMWTYYQGDAQRLNAALGALAAFLEIDPVDIPAMAGEVERRSTLSRVEICGAHRGADIE
ncbi:MAG: ArsR/SmtB family transcription factor [Symbiobacteriia bacterium]